MQLEDFLEERQIERIVLSFVESECRKQIEKDGKATGVDTETVQEFLNACTTSFIEIEMIKMAANGKIAIGWNEQKELYFWAGKNES